MSAAPTANHALIPPTDNNPDSHSHHSPMGQDINNNPPAFPKPPEGCTDYKAQTSCPFSLPTYTWWCKRPPLELHISCAFIFHEGTSLCSLQGHGDSACLQQPRGQARVCHCVGSLAIRRALKAVPSYTLAKLLSGRRNSSLLAGCHRLRGAVPSRCSSCSSSPLLGASPCPARVQSLAALLQGQ